MPTTIMQGKTLSTVELNWKETAAKLPEATVVRLG